MFLAAASVILIVAAALPFGYKRFFSKEAAVVQPQMVQLPSDTGPKRIAGDEPLEQMPLFDSGPGSMVFENFIVLAPVSKDGVGFITASVSIEYSNGRARYEIKKKMPLYRDIIYDAMGSALQSKNPKKVTEADLLGNIKSALNRVLPKQYIDKVTFTTFNTG